MTRALLGVLLSSAVACAGSRGEAPPAEAPPSAAPAVAPEASAGDDEGLWERCRHSVEARCSAANPAGGAGERDCRDKAAARYARIKSQAARREYLLGLGCRPADAG